jgi:hypothetical protein
MAISKYLFSPVDAGAVSGSTGAIGKIATWLF